HLSPCEDAAKASLKCMDRNQYDKGKCEDFFQAYRDCKRAWVCLSPALIIHGLDRHSHIVNHSSTRGGTIEGRDVQPLSSLSENAGRWVIQLLICRLASRLSSENFRNHGYPSPGPKVAGYWHRNHIAMVQYVQYIFEWYANDGVAWTRQYSVVSS
ncbi:hypothetical protein F5J12DRAFT_726944, partial [Pisolithus orientalis]|uniref:uncharacterized protein n=1 Tax=Pisolithus orientalis TaxID=936130 RepID=UPI002225155C